MTEIVIHRYSFLGSGYTVFGFFFGIHIMRLL